MGNRTEHQRGRRRIKALRRRLEWLENKEFKKSWDRAEITALVEAIGMMEEKYPATPPREPMVCDSSDYGHKAHTWFRRLELTNTGVPTYQEEHCPGTPKVTTTT